jgi:heptosyltransferase III
MTSNTAPDTDLGYARSRPKGEVVLVLQIGSLGDTVISLPCYREISRRHPGATIYLLSNIAVGSKVVAAEAILAPTGVIAGSVVYPMPLRSLGAILRLRREIVSLQPRFLYYLLPEKSLPRLLRHYLFFKLCGIPCIRGMPWSRTKRFPQPALGKELWESEASRLLRSIDADLGPPADQDRDLKLSAVEHETAATVLGTIGSSRFVAISVGGKIPLKNWGDDNWGHFLRALSRTQTGLAAVFIGSADERARNEALAANWQGPTLNTCGRLAPRETAALIAGAEVFVGHDTGTLHLAGAVETPIVGIYSARDLPGRWFSDRPRDRFFYHRMPCMGCGLVRAQDCQYDVACMKAHDPSEIVKAVTALLHQGSGSHPVCHRAAS